MNNLYTIFVKHLDISKNFASELVNENGNINSKGVIPRFSDLEEIVLSMTAETLGIDSENYLFSQLSHHKINMPNLISCRQLND